MQQLRWHITAAAKLLAQLADPDLQHPELQ
jgi:hypothetical protein